MYIFARFHARTGCENDVAGAIDRVSVLTRAESGCLHFQGFQARGDTRLFFIHSRWVSELAFDEHANMPHTVQFIESVSSWVDQPPEIVRSDAIV